MLGGDCGATIQYTGNALLADDPKQTKVPGKLDFSIVPKKDKAIAQIGIFIAGVPKTAPNKANAIEFPEMVRHARTFRPSCRRRALSRSSGGPSRFPLQATA